MSLDQMTLVYGALGILGAGLVFLFARMDRFVTRDELKGVGDRLDRLHDSLHGLRNQIQEWMGRKQ